MSFFDVLQYVTHFLVTVPDIGKFPTQVSPLPLPVKVQVDAWTRFWPLASALLSVGGCFAAGFLVYLNRRDRLSKAYMEKLVIENQKNNQEDLKRVRGDYAEAKIEVKDLEKKCDDLEDAYRVVERKYEALFILVAQISGLSRDDIELKMASLMGEATVNLHRRETDRQRNQS